MPNQLTENTAVLYGAVDDLTKTADWFEAIYAGAEGVAERVPWADGRPHPALVTWLNAIAPSLVRCGARVAVVGCGLGDDARELMRRGYDVTAFDCAPTAVDWARRIDPDNATAYQVADLFCLPTKWHHRFDLVVEINTIQAVGPTRRDDTLRGLAQLVAPHGRLLVICRHTDDAGSDLDRQRAENGPPWPLRDDELVASARGAGLVPDAGVDVFDDDEVPPVSRMRALFRVG
jgi:SAM-dependent methyltransferase